MFNIGEQPISLGSVQLVKVSVEGVEQGVVFDFSKGAIQELGPKERVVVVKDLAAFEFPYGAERPVAGQWTGQLSNNREILTLMTGLQTVQQFTYDDTWHRSTDGGGLALEVVDVKKADVGRWSLPEGWRPGPVPRGTPGTDSQAERAAYGDGNGVVDAAEIDRLAGAIRRQETDSRFDLNLDGFVDSADRDHLIREILRTNLGDANLNGGFDDQDLVLVLQVNEYEDGVVNNSGWAAGDWNGDGAFDSEDLVAAFRTGSYVVAAPPPAVSANAGSQFAELAHHDAAKLRERVDIDVSSVDVMFSEIERPLQRKRWV